jgi:ADP-ribose pyrophosphatase YjhB (NUDIX family)
MGYVETIRNLVGHSLIPLVYSTAMVRDERGRTLFHHRADFGVWGLPGGILEAGESPAACVRREAREETGLRVRPLRLTAVLSAPGHNVFYPNGDRVQQITFFFECAIEGGTLRTEKNESSALEFFPAPDFPPTLPWYRLALDHRNEREPFFDPPEFSSPPTDDGPTPGQRSGLSESSTWSFLRKRVGSEPLILPGATALLRDPRGRVLLVRRMDSKLWSLPGGLLELGESLAQTVIRETGEETGLQVQPIRIRGVFGGHRVVFPGGDPLYPIATWFECAAQSGFLRPDNREIDRTEFFEVSGLPEMVPGVADRLRSVLDSPDAVVCP